MAAALLSASACSDEVDVGAVTGILVAAEGIDFGDVQVGVAMPFELEVKNAGSGALEVTNIAVPGSFSGTTYEFKLSETRFRLAPSQVKRLVVTFQPFTAMAEPVSSSFRMETDVRGETGSNVTFTVAVSGRGITSGIEVVPNPVDFGHVLVGSSRELEVQIFNRLSVAVDLSTRLGSDAKPEIVNLGGVGRFELVEPEADPRRGGSLLAEGQLLAHNASITVKLRYVPDPAQEDREDRGRWTLSNCESSLCDLDVTLLGRGTNAAIQCQPPALDFGQVNPGATHTLRSTCTNVASETVTVRDWSLGPGTASEFSVVANNGRVTNLGPQESFDLEVQFAPTVSNVGQNPAGTVVVRGRNPVAGRDLSPAEVRLGGQAGGPDIDVSPSALNFGRVAIGTQSKRRLLVENTGYDDLTVTAVNGDAAGTGMFRADRQTFIVRPGASELIEVTFEPTAEGLVTSEVIVSSDDQDEAEVRIAVRGEGANLPPCSYTLTPTQVSFGIVQVLRTTTQGVRIQNTGSDVCLINDVEIALGSDPDFTLVDGPETDITLAPGATKTILVEYTPRAEVVDTGELTFYVSNPNDPNPVVPLRGVGAASGLLITPTELDFGVVGVNCATLDRQFTIYNTGAVATRVNRIEVGSGVTTEFSVTNLPSGVPAPPGALFAPGQSIQFTVRYRPTDLGGDVGLIHIYEQGRTDPYVIPLYGSAAEDPINEDRYVQLETPEVDILWVVDNSCSMSEEQASLTANFQSFMNFAQAQGLDYQLAVVTTDTDNCPSNPPAQRPANMSQGQCGYFADGQHTNNPRDPSWRIIRPETQPSPLAAFTAIATQGINGSGLERGLDAAYRALSSPLVSTWNGGFLRPSAYLAVIFLSDEEDQSPNSVDFYSNFFLAIKGFRNTHLFSASAIVGDAPNGCGGFQADAGMRYIETANRTGGIFESICTADWAQALENLGLSVFGFKSRFFLGNQPVPSSVEVFVDGVRIQQSSGTQVRWTYDPVSNTINFAPLAIPEPGAEIVIRYRAECL